MVQVVLLNIINRIFMILLTLINIFHLLDGLDLNFNWSRFPKGGRSYKKGHKGKTFDYNNRRKGEYKEEDDTRFLNNKIKDHLHNDGDKEVDLHKLLYKNSIFKCSSYKEFLDLMEYWKIHKNYWAFYKEILYKHPSFVFDWKELSNNNIELFLLQGSTKVKDSNYDYISLKHSMSGKDLARFKELQSINHDVVDKPLMDDDFRMLFYKPIKTIDQGYMTVVLRVVVPREDLIRFMDPSYTGFYNNMLKLKEYDAGLDMTAKCIYSITSHIIVWNVMNRAIDLKRVEELNRLREMEEELQRSNEKDDVQEFSMEDKQTLFDHFSKDNEK